jgi:hypothetical protein
VYVERRWVEQLRALNSRGRQAGVKSEGNSATTAYIRDGIGCQAQRLLVTNQPE